MTGVVQLDDAEHTVLSKAIIKEYNEAIRERGRFVLGVAGGSLVALLSQLLPTLPIDPSALHLLLVDERNVPLTHPENTYNLYKCAFSEDYFAKITFPIICDGSLTAEDAARRYEEYLAKNGYDGMDLCILGMGSDGHVASLFPNHPAFLKESDHSVLPVYDAPKAPAERITVSVAYLQNARRILMVLKGMEKAEMVRRVLAEDDKAVPAACFQAEWILDEEAAGLL